ncbi:MAG TPA: glycosyltransferase family 2 protein [Gemmatimonadaceae bacterium]|nr:glycosyltransferase family 2 protein [Gemmatimonadaceae bacterium]
MLIIGIPTFNEAPTVGLVLWRIRKVFEEYGREYELLVLDDGSSDDTTERLRPYTDVLPLTLIRHDERRGYAASIERLLREAAARTRYPRRDALITMQADFTDPPEQIPDLAKRFEGGADVVVGERRTAGRNAPDAVRRLHRVAPWLLRPFVRVDRVSDLVGGFRLMRMAVVRDLLRQAGDAPLLHWNGSAANAELLLRAVPHSRRIETVELEPRYDLRERPSRVRTFASALDLYRFGRAARAGRIVATAAPPS